MVVGAYYPERFGGSLQCRSLVRALSGRIQFSILTTTGDPTQPARSDVDGVRVDRVFVDIRSPLEKSRALVPILRLLPRLTRQHDIFHFHGFTEKMLPLLAGAKMTRRRTVEKMSSVGWDDPVSLRRRPFGRWLAAGLSSVDRIVAISPAMVDSCRAAGIPDSKIERIPNGVDTERFAPVDPSARAALRARLRLPAGIPLVTFVGFWSREKGPHVLFDAWRRARQETGVDAALLFIGSTNASHVEVDGAIVERVRGDIDREALRDRVYFVEETDEVPAYLQASDIFALPSSREGLPNALLEGMASGLPSVAVEISGVTDSVIETGLNGFLTPQDDVAALASILARWLRDPADRAAFGARARERMMQAFSLPRIAERYESLYRRLLE
jgi:glycosyltransferase involved in cell wall biosynthesis